jgi:hypothetical protein
MQRKSFPKSTELQKQWLRFFNIQFLWFKVDYFNRDNRIYSLHCTESDFYRDLEKPTKLILRENPVPSMKNKATQVPNAREYDRLLMN